MHTPSLNRPVTAEGIIRESRKSQKYKDSTQSHSPCTMLYLGGQNWKVVLGFWNFACNPLCIISYESCTIPKTKIQICAPRKNTGLYQPMAVCNMSVICPWQSCTIVFVYFMFFRTCNAASDPLMVRTLIPFPVIIWHIYRVFNNKSAELFAHICKLNLVGKFAYIYDILIFLKPIWHGHIFIYFLHLPANWV